MSFGKIGTLDLSVRVRLERIAFAFAVREDVCRIVGEQARRLPLLGRARRKVQLCIGESWNRGMRASGPRDYRS